jgi:hypothetical protein
MATVGWQDKIKRQLEVVQQWRQSGQSMAAWAAAHGVDAKLLRGWASYEKRWLQRLDRGLEQPPALKSAARAATQAVVKATAPGKPRGFVALRGSHAQTLGSVADSAAPHKANNCATHPVHPSPASVRIECVGAGLVLHWPLAQTQALAVWLKAMLTARDALVPGSQTR